MHAAPLRIATFLAPNLFPVYNFIASYIEEQLGWPTVFYTGGSYREMIDQADVGFICGLAYIEMERWRENPVEPIAAPFLTEDRYQGRPIYFSDVIVRHDRPFRCFRDLRGCIWTYNEPYSQSGYGITRFRLVELGETGGFFRDVVCAGSHEQSIRLVLSGRADASAIDSHLLGVALRDNPLLRSQLRVIESFGPSTIQPVVVSRRLPDHVKANLQKALLQMGQDLAARQRLAEGLMSGFVAADASTYDDLREMRSACEHACFLQLR